MMNLEHLMKQAQQMQAKMTELQARMADLEVTGAAGGGLVTATLSGKGEMRRLRIDPSLSGADDIEVIEDLVVAAVNDARSKAEARMAEEMKSVTGGLDLPPGMTLPI